MLIVCPVLGGQCGKVVAFVCRAHVTGQGVKGGATLAAKLPGQFLSTAQSSIKGPDAGALPGLAGVMGCGQSVHFGFPFVGFYYMTRFSREVIHLGKEKGRVTGPSP